MRSSIAVTALFFALQTSCLAEESDFTKLMAKQGKAEEAEVAKPEAQKPEPRKKARAKVKKAPAASTPAEKAPPRAAAEPAQEKKPEKAPEKAVEKTADNATEKAPEKTVAAARPSDLVRDNRESMIVKTGKQCLVIEFDTLANGMLSCSEPVTVSYTKRDCATSEVQEIGDSEAQVSCPDKQRVELRFRTSSDSLMLSLRTRRQNDGRLGLVTYHQLDKAAEEESSLTKLLAPPKLKAKGGETAEESPLNLKFSGFAWLEAEDSRRFGYDVAGGQPNFLANVGRPSQSNLNFFANLGAEASRDRTSLVSLFEIGEVYFGDTTSGGGVGGRATNVFEVRNLYLSHAFDDSFGFKGGLITTASDPRSFIFNDHITSAQGSYKTDLSEGSIWYGEAAKHRNVAGHKRDQYLGLQGTLGFITAFKATLFGLQRRKNADELTANDGTGAVLQGDSTYHWLGATVEAEPFGGMNLQLTGIRNWTRTRLSDGADDATGGLLDLRATKSLFDTSLQLTLEGLYTSGAPGTTDSPTGKQIRGRRNNFVSPVGAGYLFSIATSDGVDDSPGTPKESIIANLGLDEGLRVLAATLSSSITRKLSAFVRFGYIAAGHASGNGGKLLGMEYDANLQYQLTTATNLQVDYGYFKPGTFFTYRDSAKLAAAKLKFSF